MRLGDNRGGYIRKEATMKDKYTIGDLFTTTKSQVTGIIEEIVPVSPDLVKVKINVEGESRWTTWTPYRDTTK
jgi:hypothetical protein